MRASVMPPVPDAPVVEFSGSDGAEQKRWQRLKILEIGDRSLFADNFPENTLQLWTGARKIAAGPHRRNFGPGESIMLLRALRDARFDLIVCYPPLDDPLSLRSLFRLLGRAGPRFPSALFRGCAVKFLRAGTATPLVVLDTEDSAPVERHNFFLLPLCRIYYKRELPPDHWKVFVKTAHPHIPTARVRRSRRLRDAVAKMRPLSLGISEEKVRLTQGLDPEKTTDIFFAGALSNSHVRSQGLRQLERLREQGCRVDIAGTDLPQAEYFARCARAWLTWSPEGYGWDCFRHYEAGACGSVPVISQPTIFRHEPLREGVHCFYYDTEGDGLETVVRKALSDKEQLATMARAAREHVLRHHTQRRLCEYVLDTSLGDVGAQ